MNSRRDKARGAGLLHNAPATTVKSAKRPGRGTPSGEVRIIGGQWRSRRIEVALAEGLRPTGDRVRETLFNWVGPTLHGKRCLDLFAGTGVLGLESLSRGAVAVDWVERDAQVARKLREALAALVSSDPVPGLGTIHLQDARTFLAGRTLPVYDLVFLDPPFALSPWAELLPGLFTCVAPGGKVYVEAAERPEALCPPPKGWLIIRESRAGAVWFALLQREYSQSPDSSPTTQAP